MGGSIGDQNRCLILKGVLDTFSEKQLTAKVKKLFERGGLTIESRLFQARRIGRYISKSDRPIELTFKNGESMRAFIQKARSLDGPITMVTRSGNVELLYIGSLPRSKAGQSFLKSCIVVSLKSSIVLLTALVLLKFFLAVKPYEFSETISGLSAAIVQNQSRFSFTINVSFSGWRCLAFCSVI